MDTNEGSRNSISIISFTFTGTHLNCSNVTDSLVLSVAIHILALTGVLMALQ